MHYVVLRWLLLDMVSFFAGGAGGVDSVMDWGTSASLFLIYELDNTNAKGRKSI